MTTSYQDDIAEADLGYETLSHPQYSRDISPTDSFFLSIWAFFFNEKKKKRKKKCFKGKVQTVFKDSWESKPLKFYYPGMNNFVNQW